MNRKLLSILLALVLALSLCLVTAVPVAAADPTTIESSTMVFQGTLSDAGGGVYTGTIPMVDGAGEVAAGMVGGEDGFDVYARNGAMGMYDKDGSDDNEDYVYGTIVGHDMYHTAGGWGEWFDPDCLDYQNFALTLTADHWQLVHHATGGWATEGGVPMSGPMDWTTGYATEEGVGAYFPEAYASPESDGFALDNTMTGVNNGVGSWDMDWTWGSEYIPLEYPGFNVEVVYIEGDTYTVTLTPAPGPAAGTSHGEGTVETVPPTIEITAPGDFNFGTFFNVGVNVATAVVGSVTYTPGNDGASGWQVTARDINEGTGAGHMLRSDSHPLGAELEISSDGGSSYFGASSGITYMSADGVTLTFNASQTIAADELAGTYTITIKFTGFLTF